MDEGAFIERVVKTSKGYVRLQFNRHRGNGFGVAVTAYGDDGWQGNAFPWVGENPKGTSLGDEIARIAELPRDEAERIAADVLRVWERSDWQREQAKIPRAFYLIFPGMILGTLAVLGWVVALILLLV